MPTPSTPEPHNGKPLLCLFGREYLRNAHDVYVWSYGVWLAHGRWPRHRRFDELQRTMMVVSPDLFALAEKWTHTAIPYDGFLSGVIADKMDDERADTLAHPLNRNRPRAFRNDWDALTKWLRERSHLERCNVPSVSLGEEVR